MTRPFSAATLSVVLAVAGTQTGARADASAPQRFAAVTLAAAQTAAIESSPDVAIARAAVDAAGAALAQARGNNGLDAVIGYTELPQSGGAPNTTWAQRIGLYELQANLGTTLAAAPLVTQAAAALRAATTDELVAERAERLKLIGLYFAAVSARDELNAKRDAVAGAEEFENETRARYASGRLPYLDLLRAEVATSKARADGATAQGVDANATDALAEEIGMTAGELGETVAIAAPHPAVIDDDRAVAVAFAQRPELRSADQNVRAAQAGLAAAHRAYLPPLTVAGGYGRGVDSGTAVHGAVLSASVSIPLPGTAGGQVAAANAAVRTAAAKRDSVRRALKIEVGAAARTAAAAIIAHEQTDATLEAARSALHFASMEYKSARTSGLSVSAARDIYNAAVIDDIAAQYTLMQAQATLDAELAP